MSDPNTTNPVEVPKRKTIAAAVLLTKTNKWEAGRFIENKYKGGFFGDKLKEVVAEATGSILTGKFPTGTDVNVQIVIEYPLEDESKKELIPNE